MEPVPDQGGGCDAVDGTVDADVHQDNVCLGGFFERFRGAADRRYYVVTQRLQAV